jgi:hypothetical protein
MCGEGIQPDLLQEQVGVLGRGRSGDPDTDRLDIQNEAERVRDARRLRQFDQLGDVFQAAGEGLGQDRLPQRRPRLAPRD